MIARWFWREWRSPSLLIVWLALSLAVACVLALGNISDRMEKGLSQQSREFMAGDRALRSARAVDPAWLAQAQKEGQGLDALHQHLEGDIRAFRRPVEECQHQRVPDKRMHHEHRDNHQDG